MYNGLCENCGEKPMVYDDWCHDCSVEFYMSDDAERRDLYEYYDRPKSRIKDWTPLVVALKELEK